MAIRRGGADAVLVCDGVFDDHSDEQLHLSIRPHLPVTTEVTPSSTHSQARYIQTRVLVPLHITKMDAAHLGTERNIPFELRLHVDSNVAAKRRFQSSDLRRLHQPADERIHRSLLNSK